MSNVILGKQIIYSERDATFPEFENSKLCSAFNVYIESVQITISIGSPCMVLKTRDISSVVEIYPPHSNYHMIFQLLYWSHSGPFGNFRIAPHPADVVHKAINYDFIKFLVLIKKNKSQHFSSNLFVQS